jgi:hypothetical protein
MTQPPEQQSDKCQYQSCPILEAFPNGDMQGHRLYHESIIARNREVATFFKKLTFELAKWGLIGVLTFLIYAAWTKFLQGPMK